MINLHDYRYNITSPHGENGMIAKVFDVLGVNKGYALEIGANNGINRSNVNPLIKEGWTVLYVEGYEDNYNNLLSNMNQYDNVICEHKFVSLEKGNNLDEVLKKNNFPIDFDLFSLDIDGNDYHIWKSMKYKPKLVVIEYNRDLCESVVMNYDKDFEYEHKKLWGSSALAITKLAKYKGYDLIGIRKDTLFYIRKDLNEGKFMLYNPKRISSYSQNVKMHRLTEEEKKRYTYV